MALPITDFSIVEVNKSSHTHTHTNKSFVPAAGILISVLTVYCVFSLQKVGKPKLGENRPSRVKADVGISIGVKDHVKNEWEGNRHTLLLYHTLFFCLSIIFAAAIIVTHSNYCSLIFFSYYTI